MNMGVWGDERQKAENQKKVETDPALELCKRCDGTGNEFYSMYRECGDCRGTGIVRK